MSSLELLAIIGASVLVATWLLYPATIRILAALRRSRAADASESFTVSVLIATREPAPAIVERVKNLLSTEQPVEDLEIIVAFDTTASAPDLASFSESGVALKLVPGGSAAGKAVSLNAGMMIATGDIVVLADTFQEFDSRTIPELVRPFACQDVGGVTGSYFLAPGSGAVVRAYWRFERWLRQAEAKVRAPVGATGAVYAVRRDLWEALPEGLILDDLFVPMSLVLRGYRVAFAHTARAYETRVVSAEREYSRKVRTLTGVLQLCAWLPGVLWPWRNPLWLQFVFHKLLRLLTPYCVLAVAAWGVVSLAMGVGWPARIILLAGALACGLWLARGRSAGAIRLRAIALEGGLLLWATVVAGANGLRGNWDVWSAPAPAAPMPCADSDRTPGAERRHARSGECGQEP
jgi:cellulose synthase/poly-beta-1,6-N-acetylglucosamine synthase-like glycosyltransferase